MLSYDKLERFLAANDAGKNYFYVCGYHNEKLFYRLHIYLEQNLKSFQKNIPYIPLCFDLFYKLSNKIYCLERAIE